MELKCLVPAFPATHSRNKYNKDHAFITHVLGFASVFAVPNSQDALGSNAISREQMKKFVCHLSGRHCKKLRPEVAATK